MVFRFAYGPSQVANKNGLVFVDVDGQISTFNGQNGDVYGHEQVYVDLPKGHAILDALKAGSSLKLIGDGPNQLIHLSESRQAIEAMEISCK